MYQTILVPLDGSKRAEAILPHVEEAAHRYEAQVVFLRVVTPPPYIMNTQSAQFDTWQEVIEQATQEAEGYLSAVQGEFREKGIAAKAEIAYGPIVETIIDAAERNNADLIAMASHGRTGLGSVFYGSVAAGILHRIDRPLLIIRSI
jgi:nucleotide-binding universal stress UspA family protein